ncbi:HTTM domain-containing protein [Paracoccus albus]|uniref:HTTM domain-containing protein n=1 Tax=Paracoccus albus TaxID=3017784 RepID=UPI0022F08979|nr:HTTM domain-containing protein [Paracoccus albus]WBU62114.1 HTTM domain-containing protein [Paracoccus albus]
MTRMDQVATMWNRATGSLSKPVSGLSLAVFRIALGALLLWDCWRFIKYDRIWRYWIEPDFHFTYAGFAWVTPLPATWLYAAWAAMGICAFLVMIGLFYRVAIVALTVIFSYFFLLDKAEYLNHFYLVILFMILLCFLPAQRRLSVDARRKVHDTYVPYAAVFILRAQMEVMLIFAGLVKLTPDWLAGEPLGLWLRAQAGDFPFGVLFSYDWAIIGASWGTIALHLLGAPLLLWRKTRLAIFIVYCLFHSANAMFFNIGIFPWLTIAATTIFFAPDWPHRAARWLLGRFEELPPMTPAPAPLLRPISGVALASIMVWMALQLFLPLRAGLFPSEVRWSGDGHRFSWRMRIFDRYAEGRFIVSAHGREWVIDPFEYLSERQATKMLVRPDMIHQFARYLQGIWLDRGYSKVAVRADIGKSLNGRPLQTYVDPGVDLTAVSVQLLSADDWILPLRDCPVGSNACLR